MILINIKVIHVTSHDMLTKIFVFVLLKYKREPSKLFLQQFNPLLFSLFMIRLTCPGLSCAPAASKFIDPHEYFNKFLFIFTQ